MSRSRLSRSEFWALVRSFIASVVAGAAAVVLAGLVTRRIGLFPLSAMICLMRFQLDLAKVKLQGVAPES